MTRYVLFARTSSTGAADRGGDLVQIRVGERPAVEEQPAVAYDPDHGRFALPQRRGQALVDGAGEARQLRERQRAAADAGDRLLDRSTCQLRKPLGPSADCLRELVQHA